ncbi:hypothetical protein B7494_g1430 [Chlorociboria aeruginascens]|nr:hypothetical protein B7494_g1430 [Chlorociboria aeruginascens]
MIDRKFDSPSYLLQTFVPLPARDANLAIRALNIELARIPDMVSNAIVGAQRIKFWRDNLSSTFNSTHSKEPVAILLHHALSSLQRRHPRHNEHVMKIWLLKVVKAREQYMDNRPYTSLDALENYAENTYSTLMYLTLAALPLHSMAADHVASHIGKATGITAVLRGLPLLAFPPAPNHHSNNAASSGAVGGMAGGRQGTVMLPLDIMAECGVKEEEVLRKGAQAPGLKDAIFKIATRANDHLIMARELLKNLRQGKDAGHEYEYENEAGHRYTESRSRESSTPADELERGFGVLMPALSTRLWLERLERYDFDVFRPELRRREWTLPWKAYWAYSQRSL